MSTPKRAVAYRVTPGDEPNIDWAGVVSPDLVLSPAQAVEALRVHEFDEAFVAITQDSARTVRQLWNQPIDSDYEKDT